MMSIFTKLKTATDFSASVIKDGFALIWPEKSENGTVSLKCKLADGSVQEISGGGTVDESRLLPENPAVGDIPIRKGGGGVDANTLLMLHFDEESGTPADSSQAALTINAGDTAVYSNGKFSRARNLNNSYLSTTCSAMATGAGDFTYDGWFYLTSTNKRRGLFTSGSNCICFAAWEDNKFALGLSSTGNSWTYDHFDNNRFDFTFSANTWYHIAVVRNGNTLNVYVNGNSISSFDVSNLDVPAASGTDAFKIGYPLGGMSNSTDIVDEFRFSNVARWTEDFEPPTAPYEKADEYWGTTTAQEISSDAITAHNTSLDAHPMQGAATNDYNGLDTNGSWYLSYGNNTSNVNAPANGPFFVMTKKWTNSSGSAGAAMQVAVRNMIGTLTTQEMYIRTASLSGGSLSWRTWQKVGSSAMVGTPDYGAGVDITAASAQAGYTCTSAGWIRADLSGSGEGLKINETAFGTTHNSYFLPVSTGDVITLVHHESNYSSQIKFYPNR